MKKFRTPKKFQKFQMSDFFADIYAFFGRGEGEKEKAPRLERGAFFIGETGEIYLM